mmetsp:Transcript_10201/g.8758  ORF Transcript_10201/g.8758 Transcript_10201/m.8758 type:complete len:140 (-) Transcript_10201:116-535(-)
MNKVFLAFNEGLLGFTFKIRAIHTPINRDQKAKLIGSRIYGIDYGVHIPFGLFNDGVELSQNLDYLILVRWDSVKLRMPQIEGTMVLKGSYYDIFASAFWYFRIFDLGVLPCCGDSHYDFILMDFEIARPYLDFLFFWH